MSTLVQSPFEVFLDRDGTPLEGGKVYIGTVGQNPETNPINVFWDSALTIPAAQPIRTSGGYPYLSGTPARVFVSDDYSITVKDRNDALVFSDWSGSAFSASSLLAKIKSLDGSGSGLVAEGLQSTQITDLNFDPTLLGLSVREMRAYATSLNPANPPVAGYDYYLVQLLYVATGEFRVVVTPFGANGIQYGRIWTASAWGSWLPLSATGSNPFLFGTRNIGIGTGALSVLTLGTDNVAVGNSALNSVTTGVGNVAIGSSALALSATASNNIAIGLNALAANTTGTPNLAIGTSALGANTTGINNIAIGHNALAVSTVAVSNIAIGSGALSLTTTGSTNIAIGKSSLASNTTGSTNIAIGNDTLNANTIGTNNVAIGPSALNKSTIASNSVAIGTASLFSNTTGADSIAIGNNTLFFNTTGSNNIAIGSSSMMANTTGANNTALGYQSLAANTTGISNTALGYQSLLANTNGTTNTAVGYQSLAANTTGATNTAVGYQSLAANTTGATNTAIGYQSLVANTTGINNTALGYQALNTTTTGTNNTAIGYQATAAAAGSTNSVTLGNGSVTIIRAAVTTITAISDKRDKIDIDDLPPMLDVIKSVKPVTFRWDLRERYATKDNTGDVMRDQDGMPIYDKPSDGSLADDHFTMGIISQELKELQERFNMPWLSLVYDENPNRIEARPGNLLLPAIKAIQELAERVESLEAKLA